MRPRNAIRYLRAISGAQKRYGHTTVRMKVKDNWYTAMVDSGADGNYMTPKLCNKLQLPWKEKQHPYDITGAEGYAFKYDEGKVLRETDQLDVYIEGQKQDVIFDIMPLGGYDIILGQPWLHQYNPSINWRTGQMTFPHPPETDDNLEERSQYSTESEYRHEDTTETSPKGTRRTKEKGHERRTRRIVAFIRQRFRLLNSILEKENTTTSRMRNVPPQYHQYDKVFREKFEEGLPDRSEWDHEIVLMEGKTPRFHKIYNLNEIELKELREYLEDKLAKGYIRRSKSSAGYPIMFVPKKNGKLRLVIDYRQLNEITVKDRTPLPLITEMKDRLHEAKWFTTLDLKDGYYHIRIKPGDEWKTAFRTKYGLFEYLVMPFGLTNAPASFQRMINHVLREYLDVFVVCYLDDILIYSDSEEQHEEHVHKVLQTLQDANLLVEPEKSVFHVQEVEFLGHIITPEHIRMDPKKIATIKDWKVPTSVKEVQAFLGLANYYRKFIRRFGHIATPLTELTKKDRRFIWTDKANESFEKLKDAITSEPVLIMYDPKRPVELETDASDYALGAQIGQRDEEGKLHPIAFYSHKLTKTELNYPIYDKEFLAIVNAFKEFRHYLMGNMHQVKVYTDHKNIAHFSTTQTLSGRQLRYAEYLAEFDYIIIHRKGSENGRADAISRQPAMEEKYIPIKHAVFRQTPEGHLEQRQIAAIRITQDDLHKQIEQHNNELPTEKQTEKLQVPRELQEQLVQEIHEHPLHGHPGDHKLLERLQRTYVFDKMKSVVQRVRRRCDICGKTKARRHKPYGELQPLPVNERPWESITFDFITKLPISEDPATRNGYDSIFVIVDRFTKFSYFIPYNEDTDAEQMAYIFLRHIVAIHGLAFEIISDRGTTFASKFWQSLMMRLGLNPKLTTAFRPQVDGQTERTNQTLETYLRQYINHEQNNWVEWLPIAQLAYNTAYHESIRTTPANANFGFTPDAYRDAHKKGPDNIKAMLTSEQLKQLHKKMKAELELVRQRMSRYYNQKRLKGPTFSEGDMVYLATKNITTKRPSKKLDYKYIGPYPVIKRISENNYELDLPSGVRIHPIFHVSLLESATDVDATEAGRDDVEVETDEYEAEKILDVRTKDGRIEYEVKWKGYDNSENTWEPANHLMNAQRLLKNFHQHRRKRQQE